MSNNNKIGDSRSNHTWSQQIERDYFKYSKSVTTCYTNQEEKLSSPIISRLSLEFQL